MKFQGRSKDSREARKKMPKKFVLMGGGLVFLGSTNTIAGQTVPL